MRASWSLRTANHVENAIFRPVWTNLAVDDDIRRLGQRRVAREGSFSSAIIPSTIDQVVATYEDPFLMVVSAVARNQNSVVFAALELHTELSG